MNTDKRRMRARGKFTRVPNLLIYSGLSPHAKLVYLVLKSHAWDGTCWPSLPTIAEEAGVSVATARRAKKELEDTGWVTVIKLGKGRPSYRGRELKRTYGDDIIEGDVEDHLVCIEANNRTAYRVHDTPQTVAGSDPYAPETPVEADFLQKGA